MDDVCDHVTSVWACYGLQLGPVGDKYVRVTVGPTFPTSDLCADLADKFNSTVVSEMKNNTHHMIITPRHDHDAARSGRASSACCSLLGVVVLAAAALTAGIAMPW